MKVALYARVSSARQDTVLSLGGQLRALREYAASHGYDVAREFVDESESGRTSDRPAFLEMIGLAKLKTPPFQAIVVWKLNRFARNRIDSITYKTLLRNKGVQVISINEPIDDSPTGRLTEGLIESIDEFYSANLAQDIKRGMRENAARGFFNGSRPPYGFRKVPVKDGGKTRHRLEPEDSSCASVQVVRRMFDLVANGTGCKAIAQLLNREGIRTSTGNRWGAVTVHKVLTNEAYKGTLLWGGRPGHPAARSGDTPVRVDGAWPAIVNRETFDLTQTRLSRRAPRAVHPRTVSSAYLLSGLLYCRCGASMTGRSAKSGRHFYYGCSRASKQGREACSQRMLPREKLERLVIEQLRDRVLTEKNLEQLVMLVNEKLEGAAKELNERLKLIELETTDVTSRLSRLYDALETGKVTVDDLAPRLKELRRRLSDLQQAKVKVGTETVARGVQRLDASTVLAYAQDLIGLLNESEHTERKAFLRSFVRGITITGGQGKIRYVMPLPPDGKRTGYLEVLPIATLGGPGGTRTPDLLNAIEARSQLRHRPVQQKSL